MTQSGPGVRRPRRLLPPDA